MIYITGIDGDAISLLSNMLTKTSYIHNYIGKKDEFAVRKDLQISAKTEKFRETNYKDFMILVISPPLKSFNYLYDGLLKTYSDLQESVPNTKHPWFGPKPKNWDTLFKTNPVDQIVGQMSTIWRGIYSSSRDSYDLVITANDIINKPNTMLSYIISKITKKQIRIELDFIREINLYYNHITKYDYIQLLADDIKKINDNCLEPYNNITRLVSINH